MKKIIKVTFAMFGLLAAMLLCAYSFTSPVGRDSWWGGAVGIWSVFIAIGLVWCVIYLLVIAEWD